jgi:Peptidase family M1 domain
MRTRRLAAALLAAAVVCGGALACSTTTSGVGTPGIAAAPSPTVTTLPANCPATYRPPDPARPRVRLTFVVAPDLSVVEGTEHVEFTPDKPVTELVFRLTANTPPTVASGNNIRVSAARADHGAGAATYTAAGAAPSTQGGLLHLPFATPVPAGTTVTADLAFRVTLGAESFDRFGRVGEGARRYAWFGSAAPLLAWERGFGWHTEDLLQFTAESATSEAMQTDLTVTAPAADIVIMSGDPSSPVTSGSDRVWHASIATARDVSVAVGPFQVRDAAVNGVRLRVGAYSTAVRDALLPEFVRSITELSKRFGPYPFPSLSVARLPAEGGGIEYPSSILMLDGSRVVAVHETAHQWFYAMVGDSQALHAWLDEAFASYAEALVDNVAAEGGALNAPGAVDRSTESYGRDDRDYYFITYAKGAAALDAAREAAGPAKWDAAIKCYVAANAWRIANPSDLQAQLAGLPAAVAILTTAGALP